MHESILAYKQSRFFWWALILSSACTLLYISQRGVHPPSGGTWQGYVLGSIGTLLILWLTALGIIKRRYGRHNVQAWTSAHVYLGFALLIVATLHCAFQFGWNVHTLAYVLMCVVIFSGMLGITFYSLYPRIISRNRYGLSRQDLFAELNQLNQQGQTLGSKCNVDTRLSVNSAINNTAIGGNLLQQLFGLDTSVASIYGEDATEIQKQTGNKNQTTIIDFVAKNIPKARKIGEATILQDLLAVLCRRQTVIAQIRKDIQLHAALKIWLWIHIPTTIMLLVALSIHILAVFFFW